MPGNAEDDGSVARHPAEAVAARQGVVVTEGEEICGGWCGEARTARPFCVLPQLGRAALL